MAKLINLKEEIEALGERKKLVSDQVGRGYCEQYVCMYVFMDVWMLHVRMYLWMYAYMHVFMYGCIHVCVCVCMYVCMLGRFVDQWFGAVCVCTEIRRALPLI